MKHGISIVALVLIGSLPALAGEAQYNGPGANRDVLSAQRACEPQIGQAEKGLVMLRLSADDSRGKQIVRELQLARQAMEQGNVRGCLGHVGNAAGMEH